MPETKLPGPRGVEQVACLRRLFREPQPVLDDLRDRYGPVCGFGFGPVRMAIVGDPAALRDLFAAPVEQFRWGHRFNVLGFVTGSRSIVVSDGPEHARRRAAVQGAFGRRRLHGWIPTIVEQTDHALDDLLRCAAAGEVVDLYPVVRALVLEVTVRAFFGARFAGRAPEVGRLFRRPQAYLESPAVRQIPHPLPFTARARVREDRRALDALIDGEIAAIRAAPTEDPRDVLEALVMEGTLDDAEIRDQVVTLIGAGFDTTTASLAWMLWCAASAPGVWPALRAEADEQLGALDAADPPARDAALLARLDFANRVMRETLRLHPAGVLSPREAVVDVEVAGHRIPRGTLVLWSAHLAGRDPTAWPDPLRFDPDRFRDPTEEQERLARDAWVPFGRGARSCIGFALAQMELTLMISRLAQRLDVAPTRTETPRPQGMVVNRPAGGVPMRVAAR